MTFTITQERRIVTVRTSHLVLAFSLDDGGLRVLQRVDGPNMLGYGEPIPSIDVQLGVAGEWLAKRVFVRYLRHTIAEHDGAVELELVIGIGPLMVYDHYRLTGTLVARSVRLVNVGEDEVQLHAVRLVLPWVWLDGGGRSRFEAPGNNVRPRVPLSVAASQRREVLPRRFFAPGLREGRAIEPAPVQGAGLMAVYEPETHESLMCWYYGAVEAALPQVEGNDTAVSLVHQIELADWLAPETPLSTGTQFILLLREPWPQALAAFQRTLPLGGLQPLPQIVPWIRDAAIYEVHPALFGGFLGLAAAVPYLRALGFNTLCLMPIWTFANARNCLWDGNWDRSGDPYAVRDFDTLDPALGTADDLAMLIETAHRNEMRVLLDLPLRGCSVDARYLLEHPTWFAYDEAGQIVHAPNQKLIARFDWACKELQDTMLAWAIDWLQTHRLDGYRVIAPRARLPNWSRRLPYHTGASGIGVVQMIRRLRQRLMEVAPNAALIGEFGGPIWAESLDMSLDELAHHMFLHMAMNRVTPHELGEWLADHDGALPPGSLRACFTESHQTRLMNPLADGLRGSRISRMLLTGMVLCGFVPMVWAGQEKGDELFIGQLLRMWAAHPTLRYGTRQYNRIACSNEQVFTVLRSWESTRLLGLLNVGPHRQTVSLRLPLDEMDLPEGNYELINLMLNTQWDEEGKQVWHHSELAELHLTLEPYSAYCCEVRMVATEQLQARHEHPTNYHEPTLLDGSAELAVADDAPQNRQRRRASRKV